MGKYIITAKEFNYLVKTGHVESRYLINERIEVGLNPKARTLLIYAHQLLEKAYEPNEIIVQIDKLLKDEAWT